MCVDVSQPTFYQGEGKLVTKVTMEHIRGLLVGAGLASHTEIDAIVSGLDSFARNPSTIMSIACTFQVCLRRPA